MLMLVLVHPQPVRPVPSSVARSSCPGAALVAVPFVIRNEFYLNLASQILIYALLASA